MSTMIGTQTELQRVDAHLAELRQEKLDAEATALAEGQLGSDLYGRSLELWQVRFDAWLEFRAWLLRRKARRAQA